MSIKKYSNGAWSEVGYKKYGTETDTITTLPKTIIGDGQSASAVIKGNMQQSGTPTPSAPIQPQECGDLETEGAYAGQYKIPISSANTTTPVYLGEVESTRNIKQLVLTGDEDIQCDFVSSVYRARVNLSDSGVRGDVVACICTHYRYNYGFNNNTCYIGATNQNILYIIDNNYAVSTADFKQYLADQYTAGTPVTVWYVLSTPTTGIVNEPIRKIGTYSDSVTGTGLPTTSTAETFDVDTTLKPSEVSLTYHGWHEHQDTVFSE